MAWDTDETRRKLLLAATTHFTAAGLAGARVDAIAKDAGVNKERIYQYFGDKAGLFGAVLEAEVDGLMDGVEITGQQADALGDLAGRLYDRTSVRPHIARLLAWESLELDQPVSALQRARGCAELVAALSNALPERSDEYAAQTLLSVVALAVIDGCLPHLATLIVPGSTRQSRRAAIVAQARSLT
ncbi:TetR/AcrR family transcriptional regulator [Plantibacter sp. M259]|uniref:TetR/AcrR family transcriptional regulator n=1 Tax=Plantibacter sp. M259 TaxID=2583822 RepID=UPI001110C877|nr:TetR/AcrR family transcriptional regulator [Plantibacter sp. M259]